MKKTWEGPNILVQEFEANEYVAACWGVACAYETANKYEKKINNYDPNHLFHASDQCGLIANQVIFDDNNDGTADRMIETKTSGLGNLVCDIYDDKNYTQRKHVYDVKAGDYIYWTTTAGSRTWYHQGTVHAKVPGHPNRS